mgnify:CR=1 FL=1
MMYVCTICIEVCLYMHINSELIKVKRKVVYLLQRFDYTFHVHDLTVVCREWEVYMDATDPVLRHPPSL